MSSKIDARLTPQQRIARGLKYSTVGPVDITRGVVTISADSAAAIATDLRRRYRAGQLRKELAAAQEKVVQELAAAQEVVAHLPEAIGQARRPKRCRKPLVIAGAAAAVLVLGGVTFSILRRSAQPDPSPLPPSVEVEPRP